MGLIGDPVEETPEYWGPFVGPSLWGLFGPVYGFNSCHGVDRPPPFLKTLETPKPQLTGRFGIPVSELLDPCPCGLPEICMSTQPMKRLQAGLTGLQSSRGWVGRVWRYMSFTQHQGR